MRDNFLLIILFVSLVLVNSCAGRKNVFEVEKKTLDPTIAIKRNNLVLPPNYMLSTPSSSKERTVTGSYDSLYTFLLNPSSVNLKRLHNNKKQNQAQDSLSAGDKEILKLTQENSSPILEDIKDIVNQDAYNQVTKSKSFIRKIFLLNPDLEKDNSLDDKFNKYIDINKSKDNENEQENQQAI